MEESKSRTTDEKRRGTKQIKKVAAKKGEDCELLAQRLVGQYVVVARSIISTSLENCRPAPKDRRDCNRDNRVFESRERALAETIRI